jgi:hypothetical protein
MNTDQPADRLPVPDHQLVPNRSGLAQRDDLTNAKLMRNFGGFDIRFQMGKCADTNGELPSAAERRVTE